MSVPDDTPPSTELGDQAVAWHVRLASDAADESDWLAFEAWLSQSPAHRRAYAAVEALWADLDEAAPLTAASNILPMRRKPARRPAAWIGVIAASLVAAVLVGLNVWPVPPGTQTYQTAFGERRVVALADGSRITLNGASTISASLGRRERRVVMADAEAVFEVAKDPSRPFFIDAGDREIRVVGTEFNVLHHDGETRVTVRRGVVEVRPAGTPAAPPIARLTQGQSLAHTAGSGRDAVAQADPAAAFAWTEGRLVFRGERLAEVAKTLNRYVKTPIVVAPNAQNLPVTATLALSDEDQLLKTLSAFLPVQMDRQADSVRLSLRRQAR